jgi:hypothetical protein
LRQWLPKREQYLSDLISTEGRPIGRRCETCQREDPIWKCLHCLGRPVECVDCCRKSHERHPFHRVERWTGKYYTPAWLNQVGIVINLGHGGSPCPTTTSNIGEPIHMNVDNPDDWEESDNEEESPISHRPHYQHPVCMSVRT